MGECRSQNGRRQEYAQATRQAIIDAARKLFSEGGYFATKVDDIAAAARVSPATVYALFGSKQALLQAITEIWTGAPIVAATISRVQEMNDGRAILYFVAEVKQSMREQFGDIMRILLATAPHDEKVAKILRASARRQAFILIARRLSESGALRDGLDVEQTADVLWFYFGYSGFFTLHDENGWTLERAGHWLRDQAASALLRNSSGQNRSSL
jgi:AcrR family transcriptional regulator